MTGPGSDTKEVKVDITRCDSILLFEFACDLVPYSPSRCFVTEEIGRLQYYGNVIIGA